MRKMTVFKVFAAKKQSQFTGLRPEIRNSKLEILNLWILTKKISKQSQFGPCEKWNVYRY